MSIGHGLLSTVAATIATMVLAAGAANAQSVEIVNELTAAHCGAVTETVAGHTSSGGCRANVAAADVDLTGHVLGIESTALVNCTNTFSIRFNEDGGGKVTEMVVGVGVGGSAACANVRHCNSEVGEAHPGTHGNFEGQTWNATLTEPGSAPPMVASVSTCFITGQAINECEGAIALDVTETNENLLEAVANDDSIPTGAGTFSTHCEITGHYDVTEAVGEDIHVNHL